MKFCYPKIGEVFDFSVSLVHTAVIENKALFFDLIDDIYKQTLGMNGEAIFSNNNRVLDMAKNIELFTSFIPFEINKKTLIIKIINAVEKQSIQAEHYAETMRLMTDIENYLNALVSNFDCNLTYSKITSSTFIKASGIEIVDDYDSLAEKVIDYMELVREFDRDKLFVFVNMRSYLEDIEAELFMKTVVDHGFKVLMIENAEYERLSYEKRITIDKDLCEF